MLLLQQEMQQESNLALLDRMKAKSNETLESNLFSVGRIKAKINENFMTPTIQTILAFKSKVQGEQKQVWQEPSCSQDW